MSKARPCYQHFLSCPKLLHSLNFTIEKLFVSNGNKRWLKKKKEKKSDAVVCLKRSKQTRKKKGKQKRPCAQILSQLFFIVSDASPSI